MSIPVALDGLRAAIAERGDRAYVLTVADDGSPHAVHATVDWEGDALVASVGRRTAANANARPSVSLLYPLRDASDYSLIVDGTATTVPAGNGRRLVVTPTKAILHRPAAPREPRVGSCTADCVTVLDAPQRRASRTPAK